MLIFIPFLGQLLSHFTTVQQLGQVHQIKGLHIILRQVTMEIQDPAILPKFQDQLIHLIVLYHHQHIRDHIRVQKELNTQVQVTKNLV